MEKITDLQKTWILSEKRDIFQKKFSEKSSKVKVEQKEIPSNTRKYLNFALLHVTILGLFKKDYISLITAQEFETYKELCEKEIHEMEWGVILKSISLLLQMKPNDFIIENEVKDIRSCFHSNEETLKICSICEGEGVLLPGEKPNDDKLKLISYFTVIDEWRKLNNRIIDEIEKIKETLFQEIWESMSSGERFNANGQIQKSLKK